MIALEQLAKKRNASQTGDTGDGFVVLGIDQPADQSHFALTHTDFVLNLALADDRLTDAAHVDVAG